MPKNNMNKKEMLLSYIKHGNCIELNCVRNGTASDSPGLWEICPFRSDPGGCIASKQAALDMFIEEYGTGDLVEGLL